MATSKSDYPLLERLTRCGICKETINEPKALSCLHTFCLECLREWSKSSRESIMCPILACKKTTAMPSDGLGGLPGNCFVSSLIERSPSRGRQVPCVCCDEMNNDVLARCLDCNGFLCQQGVDQHQTRLLRSHQVVRLEDIMSGKVDLSKLTGKKKPTCSEHEGQPLWFYCETCGKLICRDCTVVMHQKPEHKYAELKDVVAEQRSKIRQLVAKNEIRKENVEQELEHTDAAERRLAVNVKNTDAEFDKAIEIIKRHVDKVCCDEKKRLTEQRARLEATSTKSIASTKEILQSQKSRLQTALDMANQVLLSGSDYDVASVYQQLNSSLEELCKIEPASVPKNIDRLPEFNPNYQINADFISIGTLERRVSSQTWVLESRFGNKEGQGKLFCPTGISTTPTGDIAVANFKSSSTPVKVYSCNGQFKFELDKSSSDACSVHVSHLGQFYVTTGAYEYVKVFGSDGRYLFQFAAISPVGVSSDVERTLLTGLAISNKDQLLVGEVNQKYISIHGLDGVHITSIQVSIEPYYIATTPQGNIIVSPNDTVGVQVLDCNGKLQHTINAPEGVPGWDTTGVCCSKNGEICICNHEDTKGIYCFSSSGAYLGCITRDIKRPRGVALIQNDQKLVVVDVGESCVKLFRPK